MERTLNDNKQKSITMTQKWIYEQGLYYPVTGETTLHNTPGYGVFNVEVSPSDNNRIGLRRIADEFTFDFKIYDLGCEDIFNLVEDRWDSPSFKESGRNLGVIFNGLKGTGKTIAAKILSNRLRLPVVIVSNSQPGLVDFIQSLEFECVVLVDEAEKTFCEDDDVLLRMIESVYNMKRKVFILTTNTLDVNENLIGRPGRIRYVKQFSNLSEKAINEFLDDNLKEQANRKAVLRVIDTLAISTIDILKCIVEEINLCGVIGEGSLLNIPKAHIRYDVMTLSNERSDFKRIKDFIKGQLSHNLSVVQWIQGVDSEGKPNIDSLRKNGNWVNMQYLSAESRTLYTGLETVDGDIILEEPDENGFLIMKKRYATNEELCVLIQTYDYPSLYKGRLV